MWVNLPLDPFSRTGPFAVSSGNAVKTARFTERCLSITDQQSLGPVDSSLIDESRKEG